MLHRSASKKFGFTLVEMENDLIRDQEANFSEDKSGAPPGDDDSS